MNILCFFLVAAVESNYISKVLAVSCGRVIVSPLSRESTVNTLDATNFKKIGNFNSFPCARNIMPAYFSSKECRVNFYILSS